MTSARRARPDEAAAVARLYLGARRAAAPAVPPSAHPDADVLAWMAGRVERGDECWVTEDPTGLTALLVLEPGRVDQLYVRPDRTGRGLGSALLGEARRRFPDGLELWTFEANTGARRFYERHGFRAVERSDDNEEQTPALRYAWHPPHTPPVIMNG